MLPERGRKGIAPPCGAKLRFFRGDGAKQGKASFACKAPLWPCFAESQRKERSVAELRSAQGATLQSEAEPRIGAEPRLVAADEGGPANRGDAPIAVTLSGTAPLFRSSGLPIGAIRTAPDRMAEATPRFRGRQGPCLRALA